MANCVLLECLEQNLWYVCQVVEEEKILLRGRTGSRPPACERRCGRCGRCEPVQVPAMPQAKERHSSMVPTMNSREEGRSNYKPVNWKCKCGDKIFNPWSWYKRTFFMFCYLTRMGKMCHTCQLILASWWNSSTRYMKLLENAIKQERSLWTSHDGLIFRSLSSERSNHLGIWSDQSNTNHYITLYSKVKRLQINSWNDSGRFSFY